jgi:hypothetical protein
MRRRLTVIALAVAFGFGLFGSASAAPITCPPPQTAEKVGNAWACVNGGGNTSGATETKNPTD